MKYYVVTFTHTKLIGWTLFLHAHVRYLKKLIKEDKLQVSGPGVGTPVRSALLVFKVKKRDELDRLVAKDPYSVHGLVASSTVDLWNVKWGNMKKLHAAGPYENNTLAGLSILSVPDEAAAEEIVKADPFVRELGAKYQITEWDPRFGEFKGSGK